MEINLFLLRLPIGIGQISIHLVQIIAGAVYTYFLHKCLDDFRSIFMAFSLNTV